MNFMYVTQFRSLKNKLILVSCIIYLSKTVFKRELSKNIVLNQGWRGGVSQFMCLYKQTCAPPENCEYKHWFCFFHINLMLLCMKMEGFHSQEFKWLYISLQQKVGVGQLPSCVFVFICQGLNCSFSTLKNAILVFTIRHQSSSFISNFFFHYSNFVEYFPNL